MPLDSEEEEDDEEEQEEASPSALGYQLVGQVPAAGDDSEDEEEEEEEQAAIEEPLDRAIFDALASDPFPQLSSVRFPLHSKKKCYVQ